jgi:hypothetical protein
MSRKTKLTQEWIDPDAPTELLGEVAAQERDLVDYHIRWSVEKLSKLGVHVAWSEETDDAPARYVFSSDNRELREIAEEAYDIGTCHQQALALRQERQSLDEKLAGNKKSVAVRVGKSREKEALALTGYAELAERGEKQIRKKLIARPNLTPSIVNRAILDFNTRIEEAAARLKKRTPRLSFENVVAQIVKQHADSTPGLNEATVRAALKPKPKRKR